MTYPRLSNVEATILELLVNHGELYGLQMLAKEPSLKRGTIYVTLGRMADKGFVQSRALKDERMPGMPRRLFRATGLGQQALRALEASRVIMAAEFAYG